MEQRKEDLQVSPLAHEDMLTLEDQQLDNVHGGVSPTSTLEQVSTSQDTSGSVPRWTTSSSSINMPSQDHTSSGSSVHLSSPAHTSSGSSVHLSSSHSGSSGSTPPGSPGVTSHLPVWVRGLMPNKRRRIG